MTAADSHAGDPHDRRGQDSATLVAPPDPHVEAANPWVFWILTLVGLGVLAFGVLGIWTHRGSGLLDVRPRPWLTWFIGAIVVHDLLIAPTTLLIGRGLRFVRPRLLRGPLQVALALTALVTLLMFPLLRGYGAREGSPSLLPRDYAAGYLTLLGVIWAGCTLWAWWRRRPTRLDSPNLTGRHPE